MDIFRDNWEIFFLNKINIKTLKKQNYNYKIDLIERFNNDIGFRLFNYKL